MIIYSETLTYDDLVAAVEPINAVTIAGHAHGGFSTGFARLVHGPRIRRRRWEGVTLTADASKRPKNWRDLDGPGVTYANAVDNAYGTPPTYRGPEEDAPSGKVWARRMQPQHATYHEHGRFMANVFERDPDATIKTAVTTYHGRDDFHAQTNNDYMPKVNA
ncbi:MAG: hypothetical protein AB7O61_24845 [Acidimicrobiia bacterium]